MAVIVSRRPRSDLTPERALDHRGHLRGVNGGREQQPLAELTTELSQVRELNLALNPFGEHLDSQLMFERKNGL